MGQGGTRRMNGQCVERNNDTVYENQEENSELSIRKGYHKLMSSRTRLGTCKGKDVGADLLLGSRMAASLEFCGVHDRGGSRGPIRHIVVSNERE
jgi:hypothetical protein